MKIAMHVDEDLGEESKITKHPGFSKYIIIYDTDEKKFEKMNVKDLPGCSPIVTLKGKDIDTVYCLDMGPKAVAVCDEMGIKLKTGEFKTVKEVINNLDSLKDFKEVCDHP